MKGACVAQAVEHLTLDFNSGHDLSVCRTELTAQILLGILSLPLSASLLLALSPSLSQGKYTFKNNNKVKIKLNVLKKKWE